MAYELSDPELIAQLTAAFRATPIHALLDINFVNDPAAHGLAVVEGEVIVSMPVRPEAYGSSGNLHGGALATLIDVASAAAAAAQSAFEPGKNTLVTADLHVRYLARPHGDMVFAKAQVVRAGRSLIVVECRVVDREDRVIASADFASMVVPLRQPLAPGSTSDPSAPEL
jgi:uncharacterized protein (TIGR00369 family)